MYRYNLFSASSLETARWMKFSFFGEVSDKPSYKQKLYQCFTILILIKHKPYMSKAPETSLQETTIKH